MPYYIECFNCGHWRANTTKYNDIVIYSNRGVCKNEKSEKCGREMDDTDGCDYFALK